MTALIVAEGHLREAVALAEGELVTFTDIAPGLPSITDGTALWGDYDGDSDLDIVLTSTAIDDGTRLFRNDAGGFVEMDTPLQGASQSSVAWGDYDGDDDLDLALTGTTGDYLGPFISRIYRNDAGAAADTEALLPGLTSAAPAWVDYDNDGDLDLLLAGYWNSRGGSITRMYRNDSGAFVDAHVGLPGAGGCDAAWGDFDNDGDHDLLLCGWSRDVGFASRLFRNDEGSFADTGTALPAVAGGPARWGDYDADGDLDILLVGWMGSQGHASIHRNDGLGAFPDIAVGLPGLGSASGGWGDYDNDGDLDLALAGHTGGAPITRVYRNDAGSFVDVAAGLTGIEGGSALWGDFDDDDDLDLMVAGWGGSTTGTGHVSRLYRSDGAPANTPPSAPSDLAATAAGRDVVLTWQPATDGQTPSAGLSYNMRIGTMPGGQDICAAMADVADGSRRLVGLGNAGPNTTWRIRLPDPVQSAYYWSVQAIDGAFAGSPFAQEQSFAPPSAAPGVARPQAAALLSAAPNPTRGITAVGFELTTPGPLRVEILDVRGVRVRALVEGSLPAGRHTTVWTGFDGAGTRAAPGIYFIRLTAGTLQDTRKIALVR